MGLISQRFGGMVNRSANAAPRPILVPVERGDISFFYLTVEVLLCSEEGEKRGLEVVDLFLSLQFFSPRVLNIKDIEQTVSEG